MRGMLRPSFAQSFLFALSHRQPHHKLRAALRLLWCWYVYYRCVCWQQQDQEEGAGHR